MNEYADMTALLDVLRPWGQEHVLAYWDRLSEVQRGILAGQIEGVDWARVAAWSRRLGDPASVVPDLGSLEPASYYPLQPAAAALAETYAAAERLGRETIRAGKVACFTVAGGQGTRLGYDGPKGTFPVSPVTGRTLFQVFAESIARAREKYGAALPWFVMTSPLNDAATRAYFAANDCFGLSPSSVMFFSQGTLPAVADDGRAILAQHGSLALSPNGHGGSLAALRDSGALARMLESGIEIVSYWQVDNPLVHILDPLFIGLHAAERSEMSSRSLTKVDAAEKLGHFVYGSDGKLRIVEYSDMPQELLHAAAADGQLRFRAGSPAIHLLDVNFVERLTRSGLDLEPHIAHKAVPYIGASGELVRPDSPNAYKFEYFIFDALPAARSPVILEVSREEQFAPVKNAAGADSLETCQSAWLARSGRWLEAAGLAFPRQADGSVAAAVELSRRTFLDADDVAARKDRIGPLCPGTRRYIE